MPSKTNKRKRDASSYAANELLNNVWNKGVDALEKANNTASNTDRRNSLEKAKTHFTYAKTLNTTNDNTLYDQQLIAIEDNIIDCNILLFMGNLTNHNSFSYGSLVQSYQVHLNTITTLCDNLPLDESECILNQCDWNIAFYLIAVLNKMCSMSSYFVQIEPVYTLCKTFLNDSKARSNEKNYRLYNKELIKLDLILLNSLEKKLAHEPSLFDKYNHYLQLILQSFLADKSLLDTTQCTNLKTLVINLLTFLKNNNTYVESNEYQIQLESITKLLLSISRKQDRNEAESWKNIYDAFKTLPNFAEKIKPVNTIELIKEVLSVKEIDQESESEFIETNDDYTPIDSPTKVNSNHSHSPYLFLALKNISSIDSHDLSLSSEPILK